MALPQCMCATARVPCRSSHMVQAELYQPTQGESCPPTVVISPRMISGLCDASGTFECEVLLARREDLAGGQETALCCLYLITAIFPSPLQKPLNSIRIHSYKQKGIRLIFYRSGTSGTEHLLNFMRISCVSLCLPETKSRRIPKMKSQCPIQPLKSGRKAEKFVLLKISC